MAEADDSSCLEVEAEQDRVPFRGGSVDAQELLLLEKSVHSWSGDKQELLRLGEAIEARFASSREESLRELERQLRQQHASAWVPWLGRRQRSESEALKTTTSEKWRLNLEASDADGRLHKGYYKNVLERVPVTSIVKATFECSVGANSCTLTLARADISLKVQGLPDWTRETFAVVRAELAGDKAKWNALWAPFLGGIIPTLLYILGFGAFFMTLDSDSTWAPWIFLSSAVALPLLYLLIRSKFFPRLDLREPGTQSPRQRIARVSVATAGAVVSLLTIASGVLTLFGQS